MPKKKKKYGRPLEDRERMVIHVLKTTKEAINAQVDKTEKEQSTQGRVIDTWAKERRTK